ncbi:MAG TPA: DUF4870 domain-containing protein [Planctomycetota bacterium]
MSAESLRTWTTLCHLSALAGYVGMPLGNVAGPLVVWLLKRGEHPLIDAHGRTVLNFQITMGILWLVALALSFVLIGIPMLIALYVLNVVLIVKAAIATSNGREFQYPFGFRFLG